MTRTAYAALAGVLLAAALIGCAGDPKSDADTPPAEPDAREAAVLTPGDPEPAADPNAETDADAPALMPLAEFERRYGALIGRGVHPKTGIVDYDYLRKQADELTALVEALAPAREFGTDAHRLAFLLNAYNLIVLTQVVEHRPADTVRDVDGFFTKLTRRVLDKEVTLDALRDRMIRPLGDARAHAAMCNGAAGAPPMRNEPYTAARLNEQLDQQAARFVNDRALNTAIGSTLWLSPIYRWFADDFRAEPFGGPAGFCRLYAQPDSAMDLLLRAEPDPPIDYLQFNWALNARR